MGQLEILKEAIEFIAGQKDKTGNWAVELAKRTLKEFDGVERNPPQHMVICDLKAENNRLREAIKTVLEWSKFEECYCNKCGHGTPVKDFDYVDELKKAISI